MDKKSKEKGQIIIPEIKIGKKIKPRLKRQNAGSNQGNSKRSNSKNFDSYKDSVPN